VRLSFLLNGKVKKSSIFLDPTKHGDHVSREVLLLPMLVEVPSHPRRINGHIQAVYIVRILLQHTPPVFKLVGFQGFSPLTTATRQGLFLDEVDHVMFL
jgi:hypothetical protein